MTGHVGGPEVLSCIKVGPLCGRIHALAQVPFLLSNAPTPCPTARPSLSNPLAPESSSQAQLLGNRAPDTSLTAVGCGRLVVEAGGPGGWGSWWGPQCVEGAGLGLDPSSWDPRARGHTGGNPNTTSPAGISVPCALAGFLVWISPLGIAQASGLASLPRDWAWQGRVPCLIEVGAGVGRDPANPDCGGIFCCTVQGSLKGSPLISFNKDNLCLTRPASSILPVPPTFP